MLHLTLEISDVSHLDNKLNQKKSLLFKCIFMYNKDNLARYLPLEEFIVI